MPYDSYKLFVGKWWKWGHWETSIFDQKVDWIIPLQIACFSLVISVTTSPKWTSQPYRMEITCIGRIQGLPIFLSHSLNSVSYLGLHMWLQINPFSSENLVLKNSCVSLLNSLIIYPPWYVKPFISVVNCQEYTELLRSCSKQYKHLIGHLKTPHGEPGSIVAPNAIGWMEVAYCWKFFVGFY